MLFALNVLIFAFCFGAGLCVLIFVPTTIYLTPYFFWSGTFKGKKLVNESTNKSLLKSCKNATILYKSWILRKEPRF